MAMIRGRTIGYLIGGACLVGLLSLAGCASVPYRTHPDLLQARDSIRTVGIMPVAMAGFVEQVSFTDSLVPREDMSVQMSETLAAALGEELAAQQVRSVVIGSDDRELCDMWDLYGAIDYTVARHYLPMVVHRWGSEDLEPFPPEGRPFVFSAGQAEEAMARYGVDAVWFLSGFNLMPTTGARVQDVVGFLLAVAGSYGGGGGPAVLVTFELRGALVARDGTLLFSGKVTEETVTGWTAADFRDEAFARRCIASLLAQYRQAVRQ